MSVAAPPQPTVPTPAKRSKRAASMFEPAILRAMGTPLLITQPSYSLLNRWIEDGLLDAVKQEGMGCIVFSRLAQGLLTDKYLNGIPPGSRAERDPEFARSVANEATLAKVQALNEIASHRGQTLAQMALAWTLRDPRVTSTLIGVSSVAQLDDSLKALEALQFSDDELAAIDQYATEGEINIWAQSSDA